ncbi:ferrochelatase [bacterium]|nr:ferrochelatase [bacterium]
MSQLPYDALLVVSFGGPDQPEDVMPFLENVTRGRGVPRERLESVAEHYYHFGGKSPINEQNLALIDALRGELARQGLGLPIYFGNRNWHPMLADTVTRMKADGVQRALAFFTSAFSCYSGCRQYRENVAAAQQVAGESAPEIDKLRGFWNHPGFLEPMADSLRSIYQGLEAGRTAVLFTAHSIPNSMAENCRYEQQLKEASGIVADLAGVRDWELVYQSRSGSPHIPWLEPDVCDRIRELAADGKAEIVVLPIGFISDHMEVLYDLDTEALDLCEELGVRLHRLPTVGTHPQFVSMIVELIRERCGLQCEKRCLGVSGPNPDVCPSNCCLSGAPARR